MDKECLEKFLKYVELNENEGTTYQNMWDIGKVVVRRTFLALNAYVSKKKCLKSIL